MSLVKEDLLIERQTVGCGKGVHQSAPGGGGGPDQKILKYDYISPQLLAL